MTGQKPIILVACCNRRNLELLTQFLGQNGYRVEGAASLEELGRMLQSDAEFALGLIDIAGFDRRIWNHCETMNRAGIPFFVISPKQSSALQQESLQYGAKGMLVKPLVIKNLLGLIKSVVPST